MPKRSSSRSMRRRGASATHKPMVTRRGTVIGRVTKPGLSRPSQKTKITASQKPKSPVVSPPSPIPTSPVSQDNLSESYKQDFSQEPPPRPKEQPRHAIHLSLAFEPEGPPVARQAEFDQLTNLLSDAIQPDNPACAVYVCGTPGTGKTLTVSKVVKHLRRPHREKIDLTSDSETDDIQEVTSQEPPQIVWVNCAHLRSPRDLFSEIASALGVSVTSGSGGANGAIRRFAESPGSRVVVVLDEVDFLSSRDQQVLYAAFEWPCLLASRLVVVGIANSIDLPVRLLPWLRANRCMPEVVSFAPYDSSALHAIVQQRVHAQAENCGEAALSDVAISLAAKKVAAGSGDARLVLDVCREAETAIRRDGADGKNAISVVSAIINKRGGYSAAVETIRHLPVQQQLALCVAANAVLFSAESARTDFIGKKSLNRKATLGGLYDSFVRMCTRARVSCVPFPEFADMCCNALVHHGLVDVPNSRGKGKSGSKTLRSRAIRLRVPIEDVRAGVANCGFLPFLLAR